MVRPGARGAEPPERPNLREPHLTDNVSRSWMPEKSENRASAGRAGPGRQAGLKTRESRLVPSKGRGIIGIPTEAIILRIDETEPRRRNPASVASMSERSERAGPERSVPRAGPRGATSASHKPRDAARTRPKPRSKSAAPRRLRSAATTALWRRKPPREA